MLYHKDWLTYSGGTEHCEMYYDISDSLAQMVNFPTSIPGSCNPAL